MFLKKLFILSASVLPLFFYGCDDDDTATADNASKPEMNIIVSPQDGLSYGDKVFVTGTLTDERNLKMYTILLKDKNETELYRKEQMLLGQSFQMNEKLSIPLPKNAEVENLQLEVTLENSRTGKLTQSFDLTSLKVPTFNKLYLLLGNKSVVELSPNGDVFEVEETFPANVKGVISTTPTNTGLYWGTKDGEIQTMTKDSILIGSASEASCKITFNPKTFELTFGERHGWITLPTTDSYYILGTISGHWQDGEIKEEKAKMRMQGYESGNLRYYTWFPPEGEDPETGMWGSIAAGVFRLKKAGTDAYILWDGNRILNGTTNDTGRSFPITAGGAFEIRIYFEGDECTKVSVMGSDRALEFATGQVKANGVAMNNEIDFAGAQLKLKEGTSYIYEGKVALTKGQSVTSDLVDLSLFTENKVQNNIFSGSGNATWTLLAPSADYIIRLDAFSGSSYACPVDGYPNAIYMDGWSWAYSETSTGVVWSDDLILPLIKTGGTTYEGSCYVFPWGGDVKFYLTHPSTGKKVLLPNTNFTEANISSAENGFLLPTSGGYFKIIVDLKEGVTLSEDGNTVTPNGSAPFTLNYTAQ